MRAHCFPPKLKEDVRLLVNFSTSMTLLHHSLLFKGAKVQKETLLIMLLCQHLFSLLPSLSPLCRLMRVSEDKLYYLCREILLVNCNKIRIRHELYSHLSSRFTPTWTSIRRSPIQAHQTNTTHERDEVLINKCSNCFGPFLLFRLLLHVTCYTSKRFI